MSTPQLFFDEFAFLKLNDVIYGSAYPAYSQASIEAKISNKPYCISIITTPNNLNLRPAKFCKEMIDKSCKFTEDFYDMSVEEITTYIRENSENDYIFIQYYWWEIGRSKEWYEEQKRGLNGNTLLIRRELDLEWTLASDVAPFTEDQLEDLRTQIKPVTGEITINKLYKVYFHEDIDFKKSYMITVDTAGGLGRDFSAVCIIDPLTGKPVGHFMNSKITAPALLDFIVVLMTKYFVNSFVVVERNIYGLPLIQFLLKSPVASRVYYEERSEETKAEKTMKKMGARRSISSKKRVYGLDTTKETRPIMVNEILFSIVIERPELITDRVIFEQITTLERKSDIRIEHADGCHDDLLMAFLIGQYIINRGRNMSKFITHVGFNEDEALKDGKMRRRSLFSNLSRANASSDSSAYSFSDEIIQAGYEERARSAPQSSVTKRMRNIFNMNN